MQEVINDTYSLAGQFGETSIHGNLGGYPWTYRYLVYPQDCVITTSSDIGRCLVYLWKEDRNHFGFGAGLERRIEREFFFATRIGPRHYTTRSDIIDFLEPYDYVCSDEPGLTDQTTGRLIPNCTPNGPR